MRCSKQSLFVRICRRLALAGVLVALSSSAVTAADGPKPVIPGTGQKVVQVGDDFEDEKWSYEYSHPKSSENIDKHQRLPGAVSKNGRFYEGIKRGTPDLVKRVATPEGGLEGSKGSLLLRSMNTGIPGFPSYQMQQDDFIVDVDNRLGGAIPVNQTPNFVVRVFMPPVSQWERRSGPHFAIRSAVDTIGWVTEEMREKGKKVWGREIYYPGFFVEFERKEDNGLKYDTAYLRIRSDAYGNDYRGPQITQTGWWTFGMSFTPEGQVHYYAKPGVEDLTEKDHVASQFPYGYRCLRFKTFFFNVCSGDDGRTWSSPFIIDDPSLYYTPLVEQARRK